MPTRGSTVQMGDEVYPRVGIFLVPQNINDQFFFSHTITEIDLRIQLNMEPSDVSEVNKRNKNFSNVKQFWYQNVPFVLRKCIPTLDISFANKEAKDVWNFETVQKLGTSWQQMSHVDCLATLIYSNTFLTWALMWDRFFCQRVNVRTRRSCLHRESNFLSVYIYMNCLITNHRNGVCASAQSDQSALCG